jgi:hypothetical protein
VLNNKIREKRKQISMKPIALLILPLLLAVLPALATAKFPADLSTPEMNHEFTLFALGTQNYECSATEPTGSTLKFPEAQLWNTGLEWFGTHFFSDDRSGGRVCWTASGAEGSGSGGGIFTAKVIKSVNVSDSIPWVLLQKTSSIGKVWDGIEFVIRYETRGGVPSVCDQSVWYSANYAFFSISKG